MGDEQMRAWRPIKTAPRDGQRVLICDAGWRWAESIQAARYMTAARFRAEYGPCPMPGGYQPGWWAGDDDIGPSAPTHWMPLPEPPAAD